MKQLIHTEKQYNQIKDYFINYINNLLVKKKIIKKEYLKEIKNDLLTEGFINGNYKCNFFLSFLKSDKNHSNINITDYLYSIESFIKNQSKTTSHNLEEFFI